MQEGKRKYVWWWLATVLFGIFIGYLITRDPIEIKKLRAELAQLKQKQNETRPTVSRRAANVPSANPAAMRQPEYTGNFTNLYTPAEWETSGAMEVRRRQGEYILKDESPVARRDFEQMVNNRFSVALSNNAIAYSSLFSKLGLDATTANQLVTHLAKIDIASLEAGEAMQQLMMARIDYDGQMRKLLSTEDYASYRKYEDSKHLDDEYQVFQNYLTKNNLGTVDPAYRETITGLIQNSKAYVAQGFSGPYDPLPQVAFGVDYMLPQYQQRIADLTSQSAQLLQNAAAASLPQEYVNLLNSYYQTVLQSYQNKIALLQGWQQNPDSLKALADAAHQQIMQKKMPVTSSPPPQ